MKIQLFHVSFAYIVYSIDFCSQSNLCFFFFVLPRWKCDGDEDREKPFVKNTLLINPIRAGRGLFNPLFILSSEVYRLTDSIIYLQISSLTIPKPYFGIFIRLLSNFRHLNPLYAFFYSKISVSPIKPDPNCPQMSKFVVIRCHRRHVWVRGVLSRDRKIPGLNRLKVFMDTFVPKLKDWK